MLEKQSLQAIDPTNKCIKTFFCVRNEKFRLAYFLNYYRNLGVKEFFAVDNDSTDGTKEYLLNQKDVHVFHTTESYKANKAGRDWTTTLAKRYGINCWCLTLDVDEFLIYPYCEQIDLNILTGYMDRWGYKGLLSIFLDFYSNQKLSAFQYQEGDSVFKSCQYYDSPEAYHVFKSTNFPYVQIKGGIRQRVFWDRDDYRSGPSMRKIPLIKWDERFEYIHSTHSCVEIKLADISAALTHFKFMPNFKMHAEQEVKRNDRVKDSVDWVVYVNKLSSEDVNFYDPDLSLKYQDSRKLLYDGHMSCSVPYFDYCFDRKLSAQLEKEKETDEKLNIYRIKERDIFLESEKELIVPFKEMTFLWPSIAKYSRNVNNRMQANQYYRIEQQLNALINGKQWKLTLPLRKLAVKLGLSDKSCMPEENFYNKGIYDVMMSTYRSIWWDMLAPFRIVRSVFKIVKSKLHM